MIDPGLLEVLRCPVTRQRLTVAAADVLAKANAGRSDPFTVALVREDGTALYPVRNGIPVLLGEEAVPL